MSLIGNILFAPLMAPAWGFCSLVERLKSEAEASLYDEGRGFAELIELSMRRSAGELSDEEFAVQEAAVLDRLSAIRESREQEAEEWEIDEELEGLEEVHQLDEQQEEESLC
jgi:hypothetical protein